MSNTNERSRGLSALWVLTGGEALLATKLAADAYALHALKDLFDKAVDPKSASTFANEISRHAVQTATTSFVLLCGGGLTFLIGMSLTLVHSRRDRLPWTRTAAWLISLGTVLDLFCCFLLPTILLAQHEIALEGDHASLAATTAKWIRTQAWNQTVCAALAFVGVGLCASGVWSLSRAERRAARVDAGEVADVFD